MSEVFFISDTHFGHKKIIEFSKERGEFGSIEEHDEFLVQNWNNTVGKRDTVWHLGDFCFGRKNIAIAERLNGYKRLVMGNHDLYGAHEYTPYFDRIYGAAEYKGYVLTHIPVHPDQFQRYRGNIHGHLHSCTLDDPRYINACCEQISCTPILFEELLQKNNLSPK